MFHMLSCFNLKPEVDFGEFRKAYEAFVTDMKRIDLVVESGPVGERQSDTPMDTDEERDHRYFVVMSFRDRAQVDAAYDYIMAGTEPGKATHDNVYRRVENPVFICWRDVS